MKRCVGCKHLVAYGAACKGDEQLTRLVEPLTGAVYWRDLRFPDNGGRRPAPEQMREEAGRCGPKRKLYEPSLVARLLPWFYDSKGAVLP